MTRKNIKLRIICEKSDGDMIAEVIQRQFKLAGFDPLESAKFRPSRQSDTDVLIYMDFIKR